MNSPTGSPSLLAEGRRGTATDTMREQRGFSVARPSRPLRILMGRLGDMGVELPTGMAHTFRQAGMEVVIAGAGLTPEMVCAAAIQEDVDVIAISALDEENSHALKRIPALLHVAGADDKLLMAGVPLPQTEFTALEEIGFDRVFPLQIPFDEVIQFINDWRNNRLHARRGG